MNQQKQPLISVIVPCFNVEDYLKECLDSILKQSFEDIEIICIDDFSTDSTPKILADYNTQNRRVSVIRHTANQAWERPGIPALITRKESTCSLSIVMTYSALML